MRFPASALAAFSLYPEMLTPSCEVASTGMKLQGKQRFWIIEDILYESRCTFANISQLGLHIHLDPVNSHFRDEHTSLGTYHYISYFTPMLRVEKNSIIYSTELSSRWLMLSCCT